MPLAVTSVLFVSRENAFRGLLGEACLQQLGKSKFKVFSCGAPSLLATQPNEWALLALKTAGFQADGLRCKSWADFVRSGAPKLDIVIALDQATAHLHPSWPGQPETATWAMAPLEQGKSHDKNAGLAAVQTLHALRRRIELLVSLHSRASSPQDLRHDLRDMAHL